MTDKEARQSFMEIKGGLSELKQLPSLFISTASEIPTTFC